VSESKAAWKCENSYLKAPGRQRGQVGIVPERFIQICGSLPDAALLCDCFRPCSILFCIGKLQSSFSLTKTQVSIQRVEGSCIVKTSLNGIFTVLSSVVSQVNGCNMTCACQVESQRRASMIARSAYLSKQVLDVARIFVKDVRV
jgi:hypothetical protein